MLTMNRTPSGPPAVTVPYRMSIRNGTVPEMNGVPGLRSWLRIKPIRVSAALITTVPAIVTGPVAPTCGAAWHEAGNPRSAARNSLSIVSGLNSSGETEFR